MAESVVTIGADLSKLRRELGKIPNMADKEMQRLLIAVERQTQKAEKAAKAANDRLKKSGQGAASSLRDVEEAAGDADSAIKGVGGAVGLFVPELENAAIVVAEMGAGIEGMIRMGRAALPVLGAMGLAAAAAGTAYKIWSERTERLKKNTEAIASATGAHREMVEKIRSAREDLLVTLGKVGEKEREIMAVRRAALIEASPRLQELTEQITAQQLAVDKSKQSYESAAAAAAAAADSGDMIAGRTAQSSQQLVASAKSRAATHKKEQRELEKLEGQRAQAIKDMGDLIAVQIENIEATDAATTAAAREADEVARQGSERAKLIAQLQAQQSAENQLAIAAREAASAQSDSLASVRSALNDQEVAILRSQATYDSAAAARIQAMQREEALLRNLGVAATALVEREAAVEAEYAAQLAVLDQLAEAGVERAEIESRAAELTIQREEQLAELRQQNEAIHQAGIRARIQLEEIAHQERMQQTMVQGRAFGDMFGAIGTAAQTAADIQADSNEDAARRSFRLAKTAALAQATINAALAISDVWSKHAANPIAAMALTIAAGIRTGAQIAAIASQQPTFDVGGIIDSGAGGGRSVAPDQVPVRALPGEAILNRSAVSRLGREGVERMNRGEPPANEMIVVPAPWRNFDRFVAIDAKRGGSLTKAIGRGVRTGRRRE